MEVFFSNKNHASLNHLLMTTRSLGISQSSTAFDFVFHNDDDDISPLQPNSPFWILLEQLRHRSLWSTLYFSFYVNVITCWWKHSWPWPSSTASWWSSPVDDDTISWDLPLIESEDGHGGEKAQSSHSLLCRPHLHLVPVCIFLFLNFAFPDFCIFWILYFSFCILHFHTIIFILEV